MIKILHIITGLNTGGAELTHYKLLSRLDRGKFVNHVISMLPEGPVSDLIRSLGIEVDSLNFRRGISNPLLLYRLIQVYKEFQPDITNCWMSHANFLGGLLGLFSTRTSLIWGVHHSSVSSESFLTRLVSLACAKLSWTESIPRRIVFCGYSGERSHVAAGFNQRKMMVIPNGVDCEVFKHDREKRAGIRSELCLSPITPIIGLVGRFHPDKDIPAFIKAASLAVQARADLRFVMAGSGLVRENPTIARWIDQYGLRHVIRLLGPREDIFAIINSLDIFTLTSVTESFPTVVLEAMACEIPCVVTDVGDCAYIVGDTGLTVPKKNPERLAQAWLEILNLSEDQRKNLGIRARQMIMANFDLDLMVRRYEELYLSISRLQPR